MQSVLLDYQTYKDHNEKAFLGLFTWHYSSDHINSIMLYQLNQFVFTVLQSYTTTSYVFWKKSFKRKDWNVQIRVFPFSMEMNQIQFLQLHDYSQ